MSKQIPQLQYLLTKVEEKFGRQIATTTQFEVLSVVIENSIGELVSCSTLKRLWGYMSLKPVPRRSTLDILSRYVGYKDFAAFCEAISRTDDFQSRFESIKLVDPSALEEGDRVVLGWAPDRLVKLLYLGGGQFEVIESFNSKLMAADRFEMGTLMIG